MHMTFNGQLAATFLLVGWLCLPAGLSAQKRDRDRMPQGQAQNNNRPPRPGKWLREHLNMPPEQQQKALTNDPEFKQLTPDQQQHLVNRLNQFNNLPPQQRERVLNRMRAIESLPPDKQTELRRSLQDLRQMPEDRRRMVRKAYKDLRQMPPEQQQQVMNSERFQSTFNDQERSTLNRLLNSGFNPEAVEQQPH